MKRLTFSQFDRSLTLPTGLTFEEAVTIHRDPIVSVTADGTMHRWLSDDGDMRMVLFTSGLGVDAHRVLTLAYRHGTPPMDVADDLRSVFFPDDMVLRAGYMDYIDGWPPSLELTSLNGLLPFSRG